MQSEIQELKERFDDAFSVKEGKGIFPARDFLVGFCGCLRFISDTPTLNAKTKKMLIERKLNDTFSAIDELYKVLDEQGDIHKNIEIIWGKMPARFTDYRAARSAALVFYKELLLFLESAETDNRFGRMPIVIKKSDAEICLAKNEDKCYHIERRKIGKGEQPLRFQIVIKLLQENGGVSAKRICEKVGYENPTDGQVKYIKDEIVDINKHFRNKVFANDLITVYKPHNKNIYSLNQKTFHFRVEN